MYTAIGKILDAVILPNKRMQQYINTRFNLPGYTVMNNDYLSDAIYAHDGIRYVLNDQIVTIRQVDDYDFDDIRSTDNVLDIGANIGAFTLQASMKAKHVFAVEPLFTDALKQNIAMNSITNVDVFDVGLGESDTIIDIQYESAKHAVSMCSFSEIVNMCGKNIDFLKCDCEGGEWAITPRDIRNIRRIEIEVHIFKQPKKHTGFENVLSEAGFYYTKTVIDSNCVIYHAINTRFENERR
jgi:FkbM family methyltransferase